MKPKYIKSKIKTISSQSVDEEIMKLIEKDNYFDFNYLYEIIKAMTKDHEDTNNNSLVLNIPYRLDMHTIYVTIANQTITNLIDHISMINGDSLRIDLLNGFNNYNKSLTHKSTEGSTTNEKDNFVDSVIKTGSECLKNEIDREISSSVGASASETEGISLDEYYNSLERYIDCITAIFRDKNNNGFLINNVFIEVNIPINENHTEVYCVNAYKKLLETMRKNKSFLIVTSCKPEFITVPNGSNTLIIKLYCSTDRKKFKEIKI